jgi:AraC-like DNA-binding protein
VSAVLISATYARGVLEAAARAGVPRDRLLAAAGLDAPNAAAFDAPDAFVPLDRQLALWDAAAALASDPAFGLHTGAAGTPEHLGTLGHVLRSSATLGDALARAARYERLMYTGFVTTVERAGPLAVICHAALHPDTPVERQPIEYVLALIFSLCRALAGGDDPAAGALPALRPVEVRFRHAAHVDPRVAAEHARVFGAPVRFGQADNALVLPAAALDLPIRGADPGVAAALGAHVEHLLTRLTGANTAGGRLRAALPDLLRAGEPTLAAAARHLAMSERTLQRRLAVEGTAFQALVDAERRDLALAHLRAGRLAVGEVAFVTGFSEPSAFRRAFRRWTGTTPAAYAGRERRA